MIAYQIRQSFKPGEVTPDEANRVGEYGIIPYPKYDEAQEEYYTQVDGSHCVLAIPKTVEDLEFVGVYVKMI